MKEGPVTAVQLSDDSVGTSALAITGLVIGASCFMINKKRSTGKSDQEISLIE
jgi:hypothetical protein